MTTTPETPSATVRRWESGDFKGMPASLVGLRKGQLIALADWLDQRLAEQAKAASTPPSTVNYPLFSHMAEEHGLSLADSDMDEIIRVADKCRPPVQSSQWASWVKCEWDEDDPACVRCGHTISLREGCEWNDRQELNLCDDCKGIVLEEVTKQAKFAPVLSRSLERFAQMLITAGLVDESAWYDPEGYDGGHTLAKISHVYARLWPEEPVAAPAVDWSRLARELYQEAETLTYPQASVIGAMARCFGRMGQPVAAEAEGGR